MPTVAKRRDPPRLSRRALLGAAGLLGSRAGVAASGKQEVRIIVAGPPGGELHATCSRLLPLLASAVPAGTSLTMEPAGGVDGVTGANRLEAQVAQDTASVLMVPGSAARAWLAGDARVHFSPGRWIPVLCGLREGILASRLPLAAAPLRIAFAEPTDGGTACLLAFDLLGLPAHPAPIHEDPGRALIRGQADAAFLSDREADTIAAEAGLVTRLPLGPPNACGGVAVPALAPSLCGLVQRARPRDSALAAACRALASVVQVEFALVLPALTPAPDVVWWRTAARRAVSAATGTLPGGDGRMVTDPGCIAPVTEIATDGAALLAYRAWLSNRLGWQPA